MIWPALRPLTQECKPTASRRSDRSLRDGSWWRISQAINCLATFIQSLRDQFDPEIRRDTLLAPNRQLAKFDANVITLTRLILYHPTSHL